MTKKDWFTTFEFRRPVDRVQFDRLFYQVPAPSLFQPEQTNVEKLRFLKSAYAQNSQIYLERTGNLAVLSQKNWKFGKPFPKFKIKQGELVAATDHQKKFIDFLNVITEKSVPPVVWILYRVECWHRYVSQDLKIPPKSSYLWSAESLKKRCGFVKRLRGRYAEPGAKLTPSFMAAVEPYWSRVEKAFRDTYPETVEQARRLFSLHINEKTLSRLLEASVNEAADMTCSLREQRDEGGWVWEDTVISKWGIVDAKNN